MDPTTNKQPNRQRELNALAALITGANKHFSTTKDLVFGGATFTLVALVALFQGLIKQITDVEAARAALRAELKDLRTQAPTVRAIARAFTVFVRATFGNQPDVLVDFGLKPRKAPAPRTVEQKRLATERALATRKARGTKGPKERQAIHGTVPADPPPAPAAPAPNTPPKA